MKPPFVIWNNYPRSEKREPLFAELGWSDIADNPSYKDTCAIRMSIALLRSGVTLPGAPMRVNAGKLKGKRVEQRQHKLSDMLKLSWVTPRCTTAKRPLGMRSANVLAWFRSSTLPAAPVDTST